MRNVYEVLRQKEMDCVRLQSEIEALRIVIPLLGEQQVTAEGESQQQEAGPGPQQESTGTEGPAFSSLGHGESSFWRRRREAK